MNTKLISSLVIVMSGLIFNSFVWAGVCSDPAFQESLKKIQATTVPLTFKICEQNSSSVINSLKNIAGDSIATIESKARPCAYTHWHDCSEGGFIDSKESFLKVLLNDAQTVSSRGFTHHQLAAPLIQMRELTENCQGGKSSGQCRLGNQVFDVNVAMTLGYQESVFSDGLRSNSVVNVKNHDTGETIEYDGDLLPNYIDMYGFYEGHTPYRLSPEKIISFFKLKK